MVLARPKPREPCLVLCRAVAGVPLPAVARIVRREARHQPVPRHLGDDGGRGDREALAVAAHHRPSPGRAGGAHGCRPPAPGRELRRDERRHGAWRAAWPEGCSCCRSRRRWRCRRRHRRRPGIRPWSAARRPGGSRLESVIVRTQRLRRAARAEHHRRRDHRPGPRAAACLVDAGHAPAGCVLQRKIRLLVLLVPHCHEAVLARLACAPAAQNSASCAGSREGGRKRPVSRSGPRRVSPRRFVAAAKREAIRSA